MDNTDSARRGVIWARVLVEGIVIVGSILLALTVDEWWEGRELRQAEKAILVRLAEEFDANAAQLEEKGGQHQESLACGEALLEVTGPLAGGDIPLDSLSALYWNFFRTPTFDPEDGVLNSLITSGGMGIITNDNLRTALAGWPSLVKDLKEDEDRAWDYVDRVVFPFIDREVALRALQYIQRPDLLGRPSDHQADLEELLRNREFENFVAGRMVRIETVITPLQAVSEGLDTIRTLLASEINR
jgi:hypothetical protein